MTNIGRSKSPVGVPPTIIQEAVDWHTYALYLQGKHTNKFHHNKVWDYFTEGELHNGCYISIEHPDNLRAYGVKNEDYLWFAERICEDYPKLLKKHGAYVPLWVCW